MLCNACQHSLRFHSLTQQDISLPTHFDPLSKKRYTMTSAIYGADFARIDAAVAATTDDKEATNLFKEACQRLERMLHGACQSRRIPVSYPHTLGACLNVCTMDSLLDAQSSHARALTAWCTMTPPTSFFLNCLIVPMVYSERAYTSVLQTIKGEI